jgi:exodeoxyribonuclease VII large subunit
MTETSYTLLQLNSLIKISVKEVFPETIWVTGEINEMNENSSGHCYLELVEKAQNSDQIIARAKATIWVMTWRMLKSYFETATGQEFQPGLKVMVSVSVEFHELYGFSLNIKDVDPIYTLGDLEQKKAEIIRQLEEEGIIDMNRGLELEPVPQRIAVISSQTAAGFQDFLHQIANNAWGYKFSIRLFQAVMQGKQAEASILKALDDINSQIHRFDAIVIIRGGGAKADLNCFNSYRVASHIAQFPLPVITGIGHERDTTIADMVAHTRMKTPTAVAEFLISMLEDFEAIVSDMEYQLTNASGYQLDKTKKNLTYLLNKVYPVIKGKISTEINKTTGIESRFPGSIRSFMMQKKFSQRSAAGQISSLVGSIIRFEKEENFRNLANLKKQVRNFVKKNNYHLKYKEDTVRLYHPENMLRKGFALVTMNGKMIKSVKSLKKSDNIETKFRDGRIESIVGKIEKSE